MSQLTPFPHDRRPVASAKGITAKPYRVPDQLPISQIRQSSDERCIDQPASEICGEPAIFILEIPINKPQRVFQEIFARAGSTYQFST